MATYVLVAGTFHGGWYWDPIRSEIEKLGHTIFAPTLSGLDGAISHEPINLDTHIEDVIEIMEEHSLEDVVLVGWSYGGMVITGVADKARNRLRKLVYLDGQLPRPGEREWDLMPENDRESTLLQCSDGLNIFPNDWIQEYEPRTKPHPLGTKLQPINYDQERFNSVPKVFVFAEKWFHDPAIISPIKRSYELAMQTPGWETQSWPHGHDLVRECKEKVIDLLLKALLRN